MIGFIVYEPLYYALQLEIVFTISAPAFDILLIGCVLNILLISIDCVYNTTTRININANDYYNPVMDYYNPVIDYYNPVIDYYNLLLRFEPCLNLLGLILIL